MENTRPSAIVHAWQNEQSANALKRLSLLFDKVYYIPPKGALFRGGPAALGNRRREVAPGGPAWIEGFSWWDDVHSGIAVDVRQSGHSGIGEVVSTLESAGALIPATMAPHAAIPNISDEAYQNTRIAWMKRELADERFLRLSNTSVDWQSKPINMSLMSLRSSDGEEQPIVWINPPTAWSTSESLTEISYLAAQLNAIPVFVAPEHAAGLNRRFEHVKELLQEKDNESTQVQTLPEMPVYSTAIGQILFNLAGQLFDDETLRTVPASTIARLRKMMLSAREELLDECLITVHAMVSEGVDANDADRHIERYVRDELQPSLRKFREEASASCLLLLRAVVSGRYLNRRG